MKKGLALFVGLVVAVGFIATPVGALPDESTVCEEIVISNTGEGSVNEAVCTVVVIAEATCENNVYILNENEQDAVTGAAEMNGNTVADGAAISGTAVNENGTVIELGASCEESPAGTPAAPVTPGTPTTGTPAAAPATPAARSQKPAALPNTADSSVATVALLAVVLLAVAVASRIGVVAYRRFAQK